MGYFSRSQDVKREILKSPELMKIQVNHVTGQESAELIEQDRRNRHYRIGQLPSGLWVATRELIKTKLKYQDNPDGIGFRSYPVPRGLEDEIERMEEFCQNAARAYADGVYIVTSFCVGASYIHEGEKVGLMLIEDLTKGGSIKITGTPGEDTGIIEGEERQGMFDLSIDILLRDKEKYKSGWLKRIIYFKPKNMINLN